MKFKIELEFDSSWILDHQVDDVLPVEAIKAYLIETYTDKINVIDETFTILVFEFDGDSTQIEKDVATFIDTTYEVDAKDIVIINVKDVSQQDSHPHQSILDFFNETSEKASSNKDKALSPIDKTMEKINSFVGAREFKELCKEIVTIAPEIKRNKNYDTFLSRNYLFSINSGYGLTTALNSLAEVIKNCELAKLAEYNRVVECNVETVFEVLDNLDKSKYHIVSIDISSKMNSLNDTDFKKRIKTLARFSNRAIFVFVIPFVAKEVLSNTIRSLNDLLFIKDVSFSPLSKKEMEIFAIQQINNRGFTISPSALEFFHSRIREEKSDGRFYGLKTITKVVNELLYTKQLANANTKKPNNIISKKDARSICSYNFEDLTGYQMLDKLVVNNQLRDKINEIISQILYPKHNDNVKSPCIHMQFVGSPGTGKTTVARIIGKILREKGILRNGAFIEHAGRDLCGMYVGQTAPKTASICREAYGSVLFIDEAYSLFSSNTSDSDYGREALDTLIAEMENHRSDMVVIFAGYKDEMEQLMKGNAGLKSRIPYKIEFPNFSKEQLYDIFVNMLKESFKYEESLLECAKEYFMNLSDDFINSKEFSNARYVRNLFERTWAKACMRSQLDGLSTITLTKVDFEIATMDNDFMKVEPKRRKIGFN